MPIDATLDHLALAAERAELQWPRYAGELGGVWQGGGSAPGFYSAQVAFANGMKIEALHPERLDESDFLRRFLDASGPGPHHLTFKVDDLPAAIDAARAAGYPPIGIDLRDPGWQEAFLHPKLAHGIVVQLAHSVPGSSWEADGIPEGFPTGPAATMVRVVHLVADLAGARSLFEGLLGGCVVDESSDSVEVTYPGPGRLRLARPAPGSPEAAWLGSRAGRVHHVAFEVDDPAAISGAVPVGDGTFDVAPETNLGVRLVLLPRVAR